MGALEFFAKSGPADYTRIKNIDRSISLIFGILILSSLVMGIWLSPWFHSLTFLIALLLFLSGIFVKEDYSATTSTQEQKK